MRRMEDRTPPPKPDARSRLVVVGAVVFLSGACLFAAWFFLGRGNREELRVVPAPVATLKDDPTVRVVAIQNLTAAQKAFRDSWLATKAE